MCNIEPTEETLSPLRRFLLKLLLILFMLAMFVLCVGARWRLGMHGHIRASLVLGVWINFCLLCCLVLFPICVLYAKHGKRGRFVAEVALLQAIAVVRSFWVVSVLAEFRSKNIDYNSFDWNVDFSAYYANIADLTWPEVIFSAFPVYLFTAEEVNPSLFMFYFIVEAFLLAPIVMFIAPWISCGISRIRKILVGDF